MKTVHPLFYFILFIIPFSTVNANTNATDFVKAPYLLYPGSNTKMLILWQTVATNTCTIDYGTDMTYSTGSKVTTEFGTTHQHKLLLDGLTPNTKYFYRITTNTASVITGSFLSGAADNEKVVSFYAYGDTRTNPATHNAVAQKIMADIAADPKSQSFIITSGDLVSDGNIESKWTTEFFDPQYTNLQDMYSKLPYLATMGNHEGQGALFAKYFPYPMYASTRYFYSFDYGPVHIAILDQYTPYTSGSAQYTWLVNDLAASTKPWKMILCHEPGWTAYGGASAHGNNTTMQTVVQPLCLQYGVQFVIAGHNHFYSRFNISNVMHITSGGAGAPLYTPKAQTNMEKMSGLNHYCKLDVNDTKLTFTVKSSAGAVIETFDYTNPQTDLKDLVQNKLNDSFSIYSEDHHIILSNKRNLAGSSIVYDNWGKEVLNTNLSGLSTILNLKKHGIYYVRILAEGTFIVKKIVVGKDSN